MSEWDQFTTVEEPASEWDQFASVETATAPPPEPADTWDYVLSEGGNVADFLPFPQRVRHDEMMNSVKNPQEFRDRMTASLYMADLARMEPGMFYEGPEAFAREIFGKEMKPSQVVSRAMTDNENLNRYIHAWNSLVSSVETKEELPPFWDEMTNRTAAGLANVISGMAQGIADMSTRPIGSPFGPTPEVTDADRAFAASMKENSRFLWEVAKDPELALQRDDLLSKVMAMGAETIPYITATSVAVVTAGPMAGFGVGWMVEGNSSYQTAIDDGVPEATAKAIGMGVGIIAGAVETIGGPFADRLMTLATQKIKTQLLRVGAKLTTGSVTEALEEASQEIAALTGESIYKDTDWKDATNRVLAAAGGGALLGGAFKTASATLRGITGNSPRNQQIRALRLAAAEDKFTKEMVDRFEEDVEKSVAVTEEAKAAKEAPETPATAKTPAKPTITPPAKEAAPAAGEVDVVPADVEVRQIPEKQRIRLRNTEAKKIRQNDIYQLGLQGRESEKDKFQFGAVKFPKGFEGEIAQAIGDFPHMKFKISTDPEATGKHFDEALQEAGVPEMDVVEFLQRMGHATKSPKTGVLDSQALEFMAQSNDPEAVLMAYKYEELLGGQLTASEINTNIQEIAKEWPDMPQEAIESFFVETEDVRRETQKEPQAVSGAAQKGKEQAQPTPEAVKPKKKPPQPAKPTKKAKPKKPERKVSKLAKRVNKAAIEKKLTESLGDLPSYKTMSMAEQASMAKELIETDYDRAVRVAMGVGEPPADLRRASVFESVKYQAIQDQDVELLRRLATESTLPQELSALGQEIKAADTGRVADPVKAAQNVMKAREKAYKKRHKKDPGKQKRKWAKEARASVKKQTTRRQSWSEFVSSIRC